MPEPGRRVPERLTDQMWIDAARAHFKGDVIVGKDLMEI
jgi:hypothetical protein